MNSILYLSVIIATVLQPSPVASWWPFSSEFKETEDEQGKALQNSPVPFEMTDAEEKFLAEARQYMANLSPLDSCHHIVS